MKKRVLSLFLAAVTAISVFAVPTYATNDEVVESQEKGNIGTFSDEDITFSNEKANAVDRIMEIRTNYLNNQGEISDQERTELESLLSVYYPDASIDDYLPNLSASTRSNPGDYQTLNLYLPGKVQETGYYCAPASGYAVLNGRGIYVSQSELAGKMGTTTSGTDLGNVAPALNKYNGRNGNKFHYATMQGYQLSGESMTAQQWAMKFTNAAISTLIGNYGVIYDVHQVAGSKNYLSGYGTSTEGAYYSMYHYVAGEGFDSSDPSRRKCYYYDSNNKDLGNHHMVVTFQVMAVLCNDRGLIY